MSVPVELERLREQTARYGASAYLLTGGDDGRPHAALTTVRWDDDRLLVRAGDRSRRNVGGHPLIALLWPPVEPGGYSLIVDAEAVVADDEVLVRPTRGVLHRPASDVPDGSSPSSDCVPILRP